MSRQKGSSGFTKFVYSARRSFKTSKTAGVNKYEGVRNGARECARRLSKIKVGLFKEWKGKV